MEIVQEQKAATQQTQESQEQTSVPSQENADLTSRVSGVSLEQEQPKADKKYDRNEFEAVLSKLPPEAQEQVKLFQQTLYKGADEKFQEAARMRQEAEQLKNRGYSKEDIQAMLQDPNFVATVQQLNEEKQYAENPQGSGLSNEEWSYLTPKEKATIASANKKVEALEGKWNAYAQMQEHQKQHDTLKTRYKNYNPDAVTEIYNGLLTGKVQANLEHLWKALDYEAAIKRSYELGKRESTGDIQQKMNVSAPTGMNVSPAMEVAKKDPRMSGADYFKNLALKRMKQMGITSFQK